MSNDLIEIVREAVAKRKETTDRLKKVLIERLMLQHEPTDISEDAPLFGLGLGLDSVDALEIVVGVEQEFGVSIGDDDMQAFRSINAIADFIQSRKPEDQSDGPATIH